MGSKAETKLLGELVAKKRGISYGIVQPGPDTVDGVPIVRVCDINGDEVNTANLKRVSSDIASKYSRTCIQGGELLVSVVGTPGLCVIADKELKGSNLARAIALVPIEDNLLARWSRYQILSSTGQQYIEQCLNTTVQKTLNLKELATMPIPVPSREIMAKAIYLLDSIERLVRANHRTNDYLAAIQQTLYCEWTQNGDLVSVGDIASVIDCLHSKKPERQKEGRPLIQLNNIFEDGILDMSETFFISEEDYEKWISRCEIQPGDCVITNVGRIGAVSQAPRGTKAAMGRNMTCIRPRAYQSTLITALCSGAMRLEIKRRTDSGTIMNALNVRNIPKLELMVPQKSKRDQLEAQLRSIQDQREVLKEECRCLGYLRDALLPKLMSGEIDVSKVELPMQPNNHLSAD